MDHIRLPSAETLREQQEEISSQRSLPSPMPTMIIVGRIQEINLATRLISVVAETDRTTKGTSPIVEIDSSTNAWILGTMAQLWKSISIAEPIYDLDHAHCVCVQTIMNILRSQIMKCLRANAVFVILSRSCLLLSQILTFILTDPCAASKKDLEKMACLSLVDLAYATRASDAVGHTLDEYLMPTLQLVKADRARHETLGVDLKVSASLHSPLS